MLLNGDSALSQLDDQVPQLGYVETFEHESISDYLGQLWRFKVNSLPSDGMAVSGCCETRNKSRY
jgi:hypothetical protein